MNQDLGRHTPDDRAPLAAWSSFQHLSVGLGFRAIPALGSFTRQFQALTGFGFPPQIAGCAF